MRLKRRPSDLSIHTQVIKLIRFFFVCIIFLFVGSTRFYATSSYQAPIRLMLDDVGYNCFITVAARNIFGWVGRHFNVIITFFIMFVVIAGKEFLC
jgi:hypothetical protein